MRKDNNINDPKLTYSATSIKASKLFSLNAHKMYTDLVDIVQINVINNKFYIGNRDYLNIDPSNYRQYSEEFAKYFFDLIEKDVPSKDPETKQSIAMLKDAFSRYFVSVTLANSEKRNKFETQIASLHIPNPKRIKIEASCEVDMMSRNNAPLKICNRLDMSADKAYMLYGQLLDLQIQCMEQYSNIKYFNADIIEEARKNVDKIKKLMIKNKQSAVTLQDIVPTSTEAYDIFKKMGKKINKLKPGENIDTLEDYFKLIKTDSFKSQTKIIEKIDQILNHRKTMLIIEQKYPNLQTTDQKKVAIMCYLFKNDTELENNSELKEIIVGYSKYRLMFDNLQIKKRTKKLAEPLNSDPELKKLINRKADSMYQNIVFEAKKERSYLLQMTKQERVNYILDKPIFYENGAISFDSDETNPIANMSKIFSTNFYTIHNGENQDFCTTFAANASVGAKDFFSPEDVELLSDRFFVRSKAIKLYPEENETIENYFDRIIKLTPEGKYNELCISKDKLNLPETLEEFIGIDGTIESIHLYIPELPKSDLIEYVCSTKEAILELYPKLVLFSKSYQNGVFVYTPDPSSTTDMINIGSLEDIKLKVEKTLSNNPELKKEAEKQIRLVQKQFEYMKYVEEKTSNITLDKIQDHFKDFIMINQERIKEDNEKCKENERQRTHYTVSNIKLNKTQPRSPSRRRTPSSSFDYKYPYNKATKLIPIKEKKLSSAKSHSSDHSFFSDHEDENPAIISPRLSRQRGILQQPISPRNLQPISRRNLQPISRRNLQPISPRNYTS